MDINVCLVAASAINDKVVLIRPQCEALSGVILIVHAKLIVIIRFRVWALANAVCKAKLVILSTSAMTADPS